jgi:hypothetical protein
MKVVAKPIEMVAWFDKEGKPHPSRFRFTNSDQEEEVIKVERVITRDKEKLAGNDMLIFNCQSYVNNTLKEYQIKFEIRTCRWILFKI